MGNQYPNLSVVIPAKNEEQFIAQTIHFLLSQDYPSDKVEILVFVADSDDRTEEVVKGMAAEYPRIKCLPNPYGLSSGARTLGAQMSTGDIIIFIDGHVYIDSNQLFRNTIRLMKDKQVFILSRPQLLDTPDNSYFQQAISLARNSWIGHRGDSTIYSKKEGYVDPSSSGASYRKEVFEKVGYFDLSFDACEDVEFNYRCAKAGFRSFTSMDLAVYYHPRSDLLGLFHQATRYGRGRLRLACKFPETLTFPAFLPSLLIVLPILLAFSGLIWPYLLYTLEILLLVYFIILISFSLAIAACHGWRYFFVLPFIYMALHIGHGWGFIRELASSASKFFR